MEKESVTNFRATFQKPQAWGLGPEQEGGSAGPLSVCCGLCDPGHHPGPPRLPTAREARPARLRVPGCSSLGGGGRMLKVPLGMGDPLAP